MATASQAAEMIRILRARIYAARTQLTGTPGWNNAITRLGQGVMQAQALIQSGGSGDAWANQVDELNNLIGQANHELRNAQRTRADYERERQPDREIPDVSSLRPDPLPAPGEEDIQFTPEQVFGTTVVNAPQTAEDMAAGGLEPPTISERVVEAVTGQTPVEQRVRRAEDRGEPLPPNIAVRTDAQGRRVYYYTGQQSPKALIEMSASTRAWLWLNPAGYPLYQKPIFFVGLGVAAVGTAAVAAVATRNRNGGKQ